MSRFSIAVVVFCGGCCGVASVVCVCGIVRVLVADIAVVGVAVTVGAGVAVDVPLTVGVAAGDAFVVVVVAVVAAFANVACCS